MAKYTEKLNLKKPEQNDFYNVDDFNGNFDKIDEEFNSYLRLSGGVLNGTLRIKKSSTPSFELATNKSMAQISKNASDTIEDGLLIKDSDGTEVATDYVTLRLNHALAKTDISQILKVSMVKGGNHSFYKIYGEHNVPSPAQIQSGSYVGTGTSGSSNPTIINCNFEPKLVVVFSDNGGWFIAVRDSVNGYFMINSSISKPNTVWEENTLKIYQGSAGSTDNATKQMNILNETYKWVAIG
jgi:hypothetical protein